MTTNKYSIAKKLWWSKIPKSKRSKMMSDLAYKKHSKLSLAQRKKNAFRMVEARIAKKK